MEFPHPDHVVPYPDKTSFCKLVEPFLTPPPLKNITGEGGLWIPPVKRTPVLYERKLPGLAGVSSEVCLFWMTAFPRGSARDNIVR